MLNSFILDKLGFLWTQILLFHFIGRYLIRFTAQHTNIISSRLFAFPFIQLMLDSRLNFFQISNICSYVNFHSLKQNLVRLLVFSSVCEHFHFLLSMLKHLNFITKDLAINLLINMLHNISTHYFMFSMHCFQIIVVNTIPIILKILFFKTLFLLRIPVELTNYDLKAFNWIKS